MQEAVPPPDKPQMASLSWVQIENKPLLTLNEGCTGFKYHVRYVAEVVEGRDNQE